MNVFNFNFKEKRQLFKECLKEASFISFDLEMTGISSSPKLEGNKFDTPSIRYFKMKNIVKKFSVLQLGITLYIEKTKDTIKIKDGVETKLKQNYYLERTFVFNLNETSSFAPLNQFFDLNKRIFSDKLNFHPGSVKLLNENKFDFVSLIQNGINFNILDSEYQIKECLNGLDENYSRNLNIEELNEADQKLLKEHIEDVCNHLKTMEYGDERDIELNLNAKLFDYIRTANLNKYFGFKNAFRVDYLSPNKAKLMKFTDDRIEEIIMKNYDYSRFHYFKHYPLIFNKDNINKDCIEEELGFSMIIKDIIDEQQRTNKIIPIIGHNLLNDLLYIYDNFIGELPDSLYEFCNRINKLFPMVIDTRIIAMDCFPNTKHDLPFLYSHLKKEKFSNYFEVKMDVKEKFSLYSNMEKSDSNHNAGYDSILTGRCLIYMLKAIENNFNTEAKDKVKFFVEDKVIKEEKEKIINKDFIEFTLFEDYINKIQFQMVKSPFNIININADLSEFKEIETLLKTSLNSSVLLHKSSEKLNHIYEYEILLRDIFPEIDYSIVLLSQNVCFVELLGGRINLEKLNDLKQNIITYSDYYSNYQNTLLYNN